MLLHIVTEIIICSSGALHSETPVH